MAAVVASDLVGNWSWTVWLLIPLVIVMGFLTALAMGSRGEPERTEHGSRGVSRYLARTADERPPS